MPQQELVITIKCRVPWYARLSVALLSAHVWFVNWLIKTDRFVKVKSL